MKWKHDSCFIFFSFTFENAYFYVDNVYFPVEDMMTTFDFQELKKWPIFIMIQSILVLHYRYCKYYKDLYRNRTVFPNKGNIYCRHLWASHRRNTFSCENSLMENLHKCHDWLYACFPKAWNGFLFLFIRSLYIVFNLYSNARQCVFIPDKESY